jgi:3-hydroxy acid dehydrogenase / malonic semialdehyde reductase
MSGPTPSTVLVTGASAGFGAEITRRYVARGDRVVATARRLDRLQALQEELGPAVLPVELDVRDRQAVVEVVGGLPGDFAEVDVLVNNAGLARGMDPAQEADVEHWEQMVATNCAGLAYCTHEVLPGMVRRGRGHVINIGSTAASYPYPGGNVYGASKAFVQQLSRHLRSDLHGTGVRVTCIEPGLTDGTEFSEVRFGGDAERAAAVYERVRPLHAADVAETVLWASTQPPHVNINLIEMMPTTQSAAGLQVDRSE